MAPNAFQKRNAHSYHKDYLEEKRLFESIHSFVNDLNRWTCNENVIQACLLNCIEHLIKQGYLNENELIFYQEWINDLTKAGYKWPQMKNSLDKSQTNEKILYASIEQVHSSNVNENEMSSSMTQLKTRQKKYLEMYCDTKVNEDLNIECKFDQLILITQVRDEQEMNYVNLLLNNFFPYIIICSRDTFNNESFNSNGGISILIHNLGFESCVNSSFKMGFKQQSFIIVKDLSQFYFWSNSIQLKYSKNLNLDLYLIRRTVANAFRQIHFDESEQINLSYCSFYINSKSSMCSNMKRQIENLIWHTNDLPSESCENIDSSKIWIPEVHDGPRADITSTLAHLGQMPILAGSKKGAGPYPEALKLGKIIGSIAGPIASNAIMPVESIKLVYEYYKVKLFLNNF
jgi:hypothetical protein